ncbi:MAG: hypothetical protein OEX02_01290 [Cyclobacteriaceae bacterium]|nr:hypothetical protein [Cyclobacteriaceae bacterium]
MKEQSPYGNISMKARSGARVIVLVLLSLIFFSDTIVPIIAADHLISPLELCEKGEMESADFDTEDESEKDKNYNLNKSRALVRKKTKSYITALIQALCNTDLTIHTPPPEIHNT